MARFCSRVDIRCDTQAEYDAWKVASTKAGITPETPFPWDAVTWNDAERAVHMHVDNERGPEAW